MGPATLQLTNPLRLCWFVFWFRMWFIGFGEGVCFVFGVGAMFVILVPFKTRPWLVSIRLYLSLLIGCVFSSRPILFAPQVLQGYLPVIFFNVRAGFLFSFVVVGLSLSLSLSLWSLLQCMHAETREREGVACETPPIIIIVV